MEFRYVIFQLVNSMRHGIKEDNNFARVLDEISRFAPAELIANELFYQSEQEMKELKERFNMYISKVDENTFTEEYEELQTNYELVKIGRAHV